MFYPPRIRRGAAAAIRTSHLGAAAVAAVVALFYFKDLLSLKQES
jgi:hypothetical protein